MSGPDHRQPGGVMLINYIALTDMVHRQLRACLSYADAVRASMPYADGGAYTQDKDRLRDLLKEADQWRQILRIIEAAKDAA